MGHNEGKQDDYQIQNKIEFKEFLGQNIFIKFILNIYYNYFIEISKLLSNLVNKDDYNDNNTIIGFISYHNNINIIHKNIINKLKSMNKFYYCHNNNNNWGLIEKILIGINNETIQELNSCEGNYY